MAALEQSSSSKTLKYNIARMPDQEFKYFRLVLMQVCPLSPPLYSSPPLDVRESRPNSIR